MLARRKRVCLVRPLAKCSTTRAAVRRRSSLRPRFGASVRIKPCVRDRSSRQQPGVEPDTRTFFPTPRARAVGTSAAGPHAECRSQHVIHLSFSQFRPSFPEHQPCELGNPAAVRFEGRSYQRPKLCSPANRATDEQNVAHSRRLPASPEVANGTCGHPPQRKGEYEWSRAKDGGVIDGD